MERLSPRERVLAAIGHEQPDRTPRDFWAEPPALERLLAHLRQDDPEEMLRQLGIDLRHLNAQEPAEKPLPGGLYQNFWGERYLLPAHALGAAPQRRGRGAGRRRQPGGVGGVQLSNARLPGLLAASGAVPPPRRLCAAVRLRRRVAAAGPAPRLGRLVPGHDRAARLGPFSLPQVHRLLSPGLHAGRRGEPRPDRHLSLAQRPGQPARAVDLARHVPHLRRPLRGRNGRVDPQPGRKGDVSHLRGGAFARRRADRGWASTSSIPSSRSRPR